MRNHPPIEIICLFTRNSSLVDLSVWGSTDGKGHRKFHGGSILACRTAKKTNPFKNGNYENESSSNHNKTAVSFKE
jgi:hypothetical protein